MPSNVSPEMILGPLPFQNILAGMRHDEARGNSSFASFVCLPRHYDINSEDDFYFCRLLSKQVVIMRLNFSFSFHFTMFMYALHDHTYDFDTCRLLLMLCQLVYKNMFCFQ